MKPKIHPDYGLVLFTCASCGNEFLVRSTRLEGEKREHKGQQYPSMTLEICSQCHPFFSGKQMYVDTAGRVEKFQRRYGSLTGIKEEPKKKEPETKSTETEPAAVDAPASDTGQSQD